MFYAEDAFAGLHVMEDLVSENGGRDVRLKEGKTVKDYSKAVAVDEETGPVFAERSAVVTDAPNIPEPPFWGVRVRKDYDLRELFQYINETALFKNQWQLKTASQEDYSRLVEEKYRPIKKQLEEEVIASGLIRTQSCVRIFSCAGRWKRCRGLRATKMPTSPGCRERNYCDLRFPAKGKGENFVFQISFAQSRPERSMCSACLW